MSERDRSKSDSEPQLIAEIESVIQQYRTRCAELMVPPGENGYSAQVLASYVALLVEFEGQLEKFVQPARAFDVGTPGAASKLLDSTLLELRQYLKEGSAIAEFRVVRDEFVAYAASEPPSQSSMDLYMSLAQFEAFKRRFAAFESRAKELEAEGRPGLREWLAPAVAAADKQVARDLLLIAAEKTGGGAAPRQTPDDATDQHYIDDFHAAWNEMNAAVTPLQAQVNASSGNIWADRIPLYNSMYAYYKRFLSRASQLEPAAKDMADRGKPELKKSIDAGIADVQNTCTMIEQTVAARQANTLGLYGIASGMQADWQTHHDAMYKMQQSITDSINRYKP
jgi:hypothetical protein